MPSADELLAAFERNCRVDMCKRHGHKWMKVAERYCDCNLPACKVPVYECRCCEVSDYGVNDEAILIRSACGEINR